MVAIAAALQAGLPPDDLHKMIDAAVSATANASNPASSRHTPLQSSPMLQPTSFLLPPPLVPTLQPRPRQPPAGPRERRQQLQHGRHRTPRPPAAGPRVPKCPGHSIPPPPYLHLDSSLALIWAMLTATMHRAHWVGQVQAQQIQTWKTHQVVLAPHDSRLKIDKELAYGEAGAPPSV